MKTLTTTFILLLSFISTSQDTTYHLFNSSFHLKHDYRDYNYELENCIVFKPNYYHSSLDDGIYVFIDSVLNKVRLKGEIVNGVKNGKWSYYDTLGKLRIEDIFINDMDSTLITNYFHVNGKLFRVKESSVKFLRTIHYNKDGIEAYYYNNYIDSNNVNINFDSSGRITHQSSMKNGRKHGIFLWTHDDGTLYAKQLFRNGKKEGIWINGLKGDTVIWCQQEFLNDKLISISFFGKKKYNIYESKIEVIDYYENDTIRLIGYVENGYITGDWLYFDREGNRIAIFKHDSKGNITIISGPPNFIPGI